MAPPARSGGTRRLTDKQLALVEAIVSAAERNVELTREDAGRLAGYGTGEVARASASRALSLPYVRDAIIQRMRAMAVMDAPGALATLRHLRRAGTGSQKMTASVELLKIAGVSAEHAEQPGNIMVQVVLPGELGALLSQPWRKPSQVIDHEGDAGSEHHLTEAALASPAEDAPARDPSPPARKRARQAKGGGRKPRRKRVARARRTISPSSGPVSGGEA